MKHPLWTRSVSLLMAVLMMLSISIPAAAVDVEQSAEDASGAASADTVSADTETDPFDDSGDTVTVDDAAQAEDTEQTETEAAEEAPVYVDGDGQYAAPETLTVYITAYVDDTEADGSEAEESYTGVVAFYDYNETDQEEMLEHPYFFYYEKGKLQDVSADPDAEELYVLSDHYLALTSAPEQETDESGAERMAYVGQERYVDPDAAEHPEYLFAFNLSDADNGLYSGSNDGVAYADGLSDSVSLVLTQDAATGGSPMLTWTAVTDAVSYNVYRTTGSSWGTAIASGVTGTSYTDTSALETGTTYSYQVRAVYSDGSQSADGVSVVNYTCHAVPTVSAAATYEGVQVTWNADTDAKGYRVLRKTQSDAEWTAIGDVSDGTVVQWLDTEAASDNTYLYAVRAYYGEKSGDAREADTDNVWSGIGTSESVYYLAAPVLTKVYSVTSGMSLTWGKVDGAAVYQVWRKGTTETLWHLMYTTEDASTLNYVDKKAKVGYSYYYRIVAVNASGVSCAVDDPSLDSANAYVYHDTPSVSAAVTTKSGTKIQVQWAQDVTATGYRVFRQTVGTSTWSDLANITSGSTVSYIDTTAVSGTSYRYTVRAYYGDASGIAKDKNYVSNLWSAYKASDAVFYVAAPKLGATYSDANGMRTTWSTVKNATGYIVYRKTAGDKSFTRLATVSGGSTSYYIDKTAEAGTSYAYTVKAICKDSSGTEQTSSFYYPSGVTEYHATPVCKISANGSGNVIYWTLDEKATGYRIYRQVGSGKMVVLKNISAEDVVKSNSGDGRYTDGNLTSGTKYVYTVRAYYGDVDVLSKTAVDTSNNWSGSKSVSFTYLSTPTMKTSNDNTQTGIKIGWTKVTGAAAYEVYRKTTSDGKTWSSWSKVATLNNGSTEVYVDTKVADGARYKYTVRAVASDGSRSYYLTDGVYCVRLPAPELVSVIVGSSGTTVTWQKVSNATGYVVYRKKSGGSWERLTVTTSGSTVTYLDTAVKNRNVAYYYTVKAYNTTTVGGTKMTTYGAYDTNGITFSIPMSGSGWVKNNGNTYYVKNGYCLTGWQYLSRNGGTYKYYFDKDTGVLTTNLYSYFGKSYRDLKCKIIVTLNKNDSNPSYVTIYLYDSTTETYCIPAVSVRCIGNLTKTMYATKNTSKTAFLSKGTGQRWLDSGSYEQYACYISGTYSWFHSAIYYGSKSPYSFSSSSYNSLINNNNNSNGCVRLQCIYAFLIQDIMKHGYGSTTRVPVVLQKNVSNAGPFGVPKVNKISSRNSDPTDPAVTGKFFYDTTLWSVSAKSGAQAWTYY